MIEKRKTPNLLQRLLRRPINWAVERIFPDGVFIGKGFFRYMDEINGEQSSTGVVIGVSSYLVRRAIEKDATELVTTIKGFSINGAPAGDWRITVEKIVPVKQENSL